MLLLRYSYRVRKPRVLSENCLSLIQYRKDLRWARHILHLQANEYQNSIEDQYLAQHRQAMKQRHHDNRCQFRKKVAQVSFKLQEDMKIWGKKDEVLDQKLNKLIHDEELKKMNRRRIIQIMKYESENYWFNEANSLQKLTSQVIFPQWIASTQYYHKLQAEALAYEDLDLQYLDKIASNEEAVKEKNKVLIPLFTQLREQIKKFKLNPFVELEMTHHARIEQINQSKASPKQIKEQIKQAGKDYVEAQSNLQVEIDTESKMLEYSRQKITELVHILKIWKEYTTILGLTSVQVMQMIKSRQEEQYLQETQRKIEKSKIKEASSAFTSSQEEGTEDKTVSLQDYLKSIADSEKKAPVPQSTDISTIELKEIMDTLKPKEVEGTLSFKKKVLDLSQFLEVQLGGTEGKAEINSEYKNKEDTLAAVEVLKELFQEDHELMGLLDTVGQVSISYHELFRKIWENVKIGRE